MSNDLEEWNYITIAVYFHWQIHQKLISQAILLSINSQGWFFFFCPAICILLNTSVWGILYCWLKELMHALGCCDSTLMQYYINQWHQRHILFSKENNSKIHMCVVWASELLTWQNVTFQIQLSWNKSDLWTLYQQQQTLIEQK